MMNSKTLPIVVSDQVRETDIFIGELFQRIFFPSSFCLYLVVRAQPSLSVTRTNITEGEDLTLTCSSDYSIPPPVFKWTKRGVQVTNSTSTIITTSTELDGTGVYTYESQLELPAAQLSDDGDYVCIVSQNDPRLVSIFRRSTAPITLTVNSKSKEVDDQ